MVFSRWIVAFCAVISLWETAELVGRSSDISHIEAWKLLRYGKCLVYTCPFATYNSLMQ